MTRHQALVRWARRRHAAAQLLTWLQYEMALRRSWN